MLEAIHERRFNPLTGIDILKKICNAPELLLLGSHACMVKSTGRNSGWISPSELENIPNMSIGKILVLGGILRDWHSQSHRALIFCQTRQMLNVLERFIRFSSKFYL